MPRERAVRTNPHRSPRAGVSAVGDASRCRPARTSQAPSLGFSQRPPLRRNACWSPLPRDRSRFGPTPPSARHVPPSPFLPASTACSTNRFAGLLRPASDLEVHRVATHRRRMPATASALSLRCLPSRAFPFREAVPASPRGAAPLPFPDKRRSDYEALFRSEIRSDDGSWPNRIARCSPGLPHLEPHPNATPPSCPRTGGEEGRHRSARARIDRMAESATPVPPPPEGRDHTVCTGEEDRVDITAAPRFREVRTVCAATEVGPSPVHAASRTTAVVRGRARGAPRDRRSFVGATRPRARAPSPL